MSLNWKEINLILEELDLAGTQIQKAVQSAFDVLFLKLYGKRGAKTLLISINPGACRIHESADPPVKSGKPLRFAEFLNSRIVNSRIEEAVQFGDNRIVRITVRGYSGEHPEGERRYIYLRLWSNAANVIVTDMDGNVLDAMRRLPKKGEITGGRYAPEFAAEAEGRGSPPASSAEAEGITHAVQPGGEKGNAGTGKPVKEYHIREFPEELLAALPPDASFNQKIAAFYKQEGGALSLDALWEEARRKFEGRIDRIKASLARLKEKERDFAAAEKLKEYGDIILSNLNLAKKGGEWLEAADFSGGAVRIKLDPQKTAAASAEDYYDQYRKAKNGFAKLRSEIEEEERELVNLEETLSSLLLETNPLSLHKLLKSGGKPASPIRREDAKRPGLSFRRKNWLIIVGRDASENDALLRRHVKGNDVWLHARDYPGSYVFIKQQSGKSVPLDILLDAGNLAIFYSKGRNSGEGDLFYTPVKYLRRAKDGPKGLVIPTQEKNLHVKVEPARLKELEECRVEK